MATAILVARWLTVIAALPSSGRWPPDNVLGTTVEPPAPVLFVLPTFAMFCLTCLHPFRKKAIVEHAIVVAVALAVVDVVTDGSRG